MGSEGRRLLNRMIQLMERLPRERLPVFILGVKLAMCQARSSIVCIVFQKSGQVETQRPSMTPAKIRIDIDDVGRHAGSRLATYSETHPAMLLLPLQLPARYFLSTLVLVAMVYRTDRMLSRWTARSSPRTETKRQ